MTNSTYASWRRGHSNQILKLIARPESLLVIYDIQMAPQINVGRSEIGWSRGPKRDRVIAEITRLYIFFLVCRFEKWERKNEYTARIKWRVSQSRIITLPIARVEYKETVAWFWKLRLSLACDMIFIGWGPWIEHFILITFTFYS